MASHRILYLGVIPCLIYLWLSLSGRGPVWPWTNSQLERILRDDGHQWADLTVIRFRGEEGFSNLTDRWNTFEAPTYAAVVSPATEADVAKTVLLATKHKVPFLATGGRHGYTGSLGRLRDGLAIDLSTLDSVEVDEAAETLTVGGGARWSQILDPVADAGFEMQTGVCTCPGVVGVTMGGGIGRSMGRFGLVTDALLSVRLVVADGRLLNVSEASYPDLFWGIRGAGANFGVVTSATYKLQRIARDVDEHEQGHVLMADMVIPASQSAQYFKLLESFNASTPENLAIATVLIYSEKSDDAEIIANWVYFGPEAEGRAAMQRALEFPAPLSSVRMVPWARIAAEQGFGMLDPAFCQGNADRSVYGVNVRQFHAATYDSVFGKMRQFYRQHPAARSSAISMEMWPNQAAVKVSEEATAYPWRDARGNMLLVFSWPGPERNEALTDASNQLGRELRDDLSRTSGYPDLSVYVSYAHSDETLEQIYGRDKLPRLTALKREWDPLNVFAYNNPLPTRL